MAAIRSSAATTVNRCQHRKSEISEDSRAQKHRNLALIEHSAFCPWPQFRKVSVGPIHYKRTERLFWLGVCSRKRKHSVGMCNKGYCNKDAQWDNISKEEKTKHWQQRVSYSTSSFLNHLRNINQKPYNIAGKATVFMYSVNSGLYKAISMFTRYSCKIDVGQWQAGDTKQQVWSDGWWV